MFVNALAPLASVSVPEFGPEIDHAVAMLLPVRVLLPPPPSIVLAWPAPDRVKLSVLEPPVTFWTLTNTFAPLPSVSVPALFALIAQLLARLLPVSVLAPPPPSIVPLILPLADSVNASVLE